MEEQHENPIRAISVKSPTQEGTILHETIPSWAGLWTGRADKPSDSFKDLIVLFQNVPRHFPETGRLVNDPS